MINKDTMREFTNMQHEIRKASNDMLSELNKIDPIEGYDCLEIRGINSEIIDYFGEDFVNGELEYYDFVFPTNALYDEEAKQQLLTKHEQRITEREQAVIKLEQDRIAAKEKTERKLYEQLRQKFGETK